MASCCIWTIQKLSNHWNVSISPKLHNFSPEQLPGKILVTQTSSSAKWLWLERKRIHSKDARMITRLSRKILDALASIRPSWNNWVDMTVAERTSFITNVMSTLLRQSITKWIATKIPVVEYRGYTNTYKKTLRNFEDIKTSKWLLGCSSVNAHFWTEIYFFNGKFVIDWQKWKP